MNTMFMVISTEGQPYGLFRDNNIACKYRDDLNNSVYGLSPGIKFLVITVKTDF